MHIDPRPQDRDRHSAEPADDPHIEPGYAEWLAEEIAAGCAELDTGQGIPAAQVWKKLGLE
jgi:hypothetical protein